jgi:transposase
VQPKLAARVRLLQTGNTGKSDPNDALSVAVAALRSKAQRPVLADDHATVLKVWAKRHRDLSRARNQVACRLHAVLCDLVPGGVADEITAGHAARILGRITPAGPAAEARRDLAAELLADIRHLDAQRREVKKKLATAVKASGTSLTEIFGVGPVIAATVIGDVVTVTRFPSRDHFAACNGTAPVECPPARRRSTGCRCAATGGSITRSIWPRSPRSGTSTATAAATTSGRSPRGRPTRKRCAA